jgi:hypothetical protein
MMSEFEVRWTNFRSFEDTGWIQIKPLTVVIGPNNGGKSAFIAPLLLILQTLNTPGDAPALNFRGEIINFGTYDEAVHLHDENRDIGFGVRYAPVERTREDTPELGALPPTSGFFTFAKGDPSTTARLTSFTLRDQHNRLMLRRTLTADGKYTLQGIQKVLPFFSSRLNKPLTPRIRRHWKPIQEAAPTNFLFTPQPVYDAMQVEVEELQSNPRLIELA